MLGSAQGHCWTLEGGEHVSCEYEDRGQLHWSITGRFTEPVTNTIVLIFLLAQNCPTLLARKRTGLLLTRQ